VSASPLQTPLPWNLVAGDYAVEIVPEFERFAGEALRLAGTRAGQHIVDVACGPGTLSFLAARAGARVSALDFSPGMLARLHARAEREGIGGIEAREGDGTALPYPDAMFDAGFSMFGLMFFADRAKGFAELRRVVRPGGAVVVSSWLPVARVPLMAEIFAGIQALVPGMPPSGSDTVLGTPEQYRGEMGAADLRDVEAHEVLFESGFPSTSEMVASFGRTLAPLVLLKQKIGAEGFLRISDGLCERVTARFGAGPQRIAMGALLGVGRVP
jgi:ubiquinone/menaquinone biosynthesis C-methylase UbiE